MPSEEERGLISRTAAGNLAFHVFTVFPEKCKDEQAVGLKKGVIFIIYH